MSNIIFSTIDESFPVSGQDNNTQGFRDNFSAIQIALETAKAEITTLQTRAVLNSELDNDLTTNIVHINDLHGSTISNGLYNKMYGVVHTDNTTSSTDIDLNNGPFQVFTLGGDATLRFNNWPTTSKYALIKVHFKSNGVATRTVTLTTVNAGTIVYEGTFPTRPLAIGLTKHKVIEAWSYDHGTTVFVRYLGEY
jgi:hypothetical protein